MTTRERLRYLARADRIQLDMIRGVSADDDVELLIAAKENLRSMQRIKAGLGVRPS